VVQGYDDEPTAADTADLPMPLIQPTEPIEPTAADTAELPVPLVRPTDDGQPPSADRDLREQP
jgi:hypothetical protein